VFVVVYPAAISKPYRANQPDFFYVVSVGYMETLRLEVLWVRYPAFYLPDHTI